MDKRDIKALIVLGVIFGIIILVVLINKNAGENERKNTEYRELTIVKDENIFFSVVNNINKISRYSSSNPELIKNIVNNDIDSNEYEFTSFNGEEMYVISKLNLYKYYVKGILSKESIDGSSEGIKKYYILNFDINKSCFNIDVITEKEYNSAKDKNIKFSDIEKNNYNDFEYINLSNKSRAILYFNDYLNKILQNPESIYLVLNSSTKSTYFNTLDDFKMFVNKNSNISISEFSTNDDKIAIKDNKGNEYMFSVYGVLKYDLSIKKAEE